MEPVLRLEGIHKTFTEGNGTCRTLDGVSLDVEKNEFVCIMGPSGCGKSTLLRIIAGLDRADSGTISTAAGGSDGRVPAAMVFQDPALFPWLSVYGNIAYGLRLAAQRAPEDEVRQRTEALLALTHLDTFAPALPHQLSGGMRQRVAVARALAVRPAVLLLDEPFSALDIFTRRELEDEILRIRRDLDTTILMVTHDPEEAVYLADRIVILSERPAVIAGTVTVDLPHPRDPADPGFIRLRGQVTGMVRGKPEGVR
jgi:ABC-type nitrate/sulfonate/bicarbonate transport system ATPase subunit